MTYTKDAAIQLWHGDCLELMRQIPTGSVDMILCDPPYGTMKGAGLDGWDIQSTIWDNALDIGKLFDEYERVLRQGGAAVIFSAEPYTSRLRIYKKENFYFLYPMIWRKNHFANPLICKNAPVSFFEDINVFRKRYDTYGINPLRKYFSDVLNFCGFSSASQINRELGHSKADHCFRVSGNNNGSTQFSICTAKVYDELISKFHINDMAGFKSYPELKEIWDSCSKKTFNIPEGEKFIPNVLEFSKESKRYHETQKPVALLEFLIKTYSNPGDTILDNCMGSGSTGVACVNTGRRFIGIELEQKYFDIAQRRIQDAERTANDIRTEAGH